MGMEVEVFSDEFKKKKKAIERMELECYGSFFNFC